MKWEEEEDEEELLSDPEVEPPILSLRFILLSERDLISYLDDGAFRKK